jgi:hypothetical protein
MGGVDILPLIQPTRRQSRLLSVLDQIEERKILLTQVLKFGAIFFSHTLPSEERAKIGLGGSEAS